MSNYRNTERVSLRNQSINEQLWRGEITVEKMIELLSKFPPDGMVRIYGNKVQIINPINKKFHTLDKVN